MAACFGGVRRAESGPGKSTVGAARLVQARRRLVDADVLAREVVEPGNDGLAGIVAAFGTAVLDADGAGLGRPWLRWSSATGPPGSGSTASRTRVRRRSDELTAAAPADAIVVQDILLLWRARGPRFPAGSWSCTPRPTSASRRLGGSAG